MPRKLHRAQPGQKRRRSLVPPAYKSTKAFEKLVVENDNEPATAKYELRLYVAGVNAKSSQAIANIRRICEEHLAGRYELEVVDLYQHPVLAKGHQIIAVPTLIKSLPTPLRKFVGDMSDTQRILVGLDLRSKEELGS